MASTTFTTRALTAAVFTLLGWAVNPLTTQAQLPAYLPTEGLVGWWPFNGNANDESGNGNNGTVNGAILINDRLGNNNAAYYFDGNAHIRCLNPGPTGNSSRSITFWTKTDTLNTQFQNNTILGYGSNQVGGHENRIVYGGTCGPGGLAFHTNSGQGGILKEINANPNNEWKFYTIVFDNNLGSNLTAISIYENGIINQNYCGIINGLDINTGNESPITIGRYHYLNFFNQGFYTGAIDDIGLWNRALTPEEITALYTGIPYVAPCADPTACNFEQEGECVFAEPNLDCAGNCLNDCNNNGVCDEDEVYGCTYAFACNYNPEATSDDGTCTVALPNYDCAGNCLLDLNNNGMCDLEEVAGCTNIDAINYNAEATLDDGSCMVTCKGDFDNDGQITINDLLGFLAAYGNQCAGAGCMDPAGCNYDPNATFDLGYCEYPAEFFNCDGAPINDADGDGIPDELEVAGCTDPEAGNFNPEATDDNGSCTFGLTGSNHTCGAENVHNPDLVYGSVTDIDGNTYRTIVIGEQEWMAENLNVEHYANGDPIPNVTNGAQWAGLTTGAWCYYNNDLQFECPYGKLYNWYVTIDARNVCPTGWHVPTDGEWTTLTDYLGGEGVAGVQMKTTGTQYWLSFNASATNESGFSGLPGGERAFNGVFINVGDRGHWWSSTGGAFFAFLRRLNTTNGNGSVTRYTEDMIDGFSVRCLRD